MKAVILIATCVFATIQLHAQAKFSSVFPVQWKTKIGVTTYRTNMVFQNGSVFIGSNGIDRNIRIDSLDGVFQIDGKTGKIVRQYASPLAGDNDVTGIALDGNKLYCGSDNYTFYCYDTKTGSELWKFKTEYDVESAPVLADFNGDGKKDVFFSVEQYGFYALNGLDGTILWKNDSISSHNGNTAGLSVDVNSDGVLDVVTAVRGTPNSDDIDGFKMAHYGDYYVAINGKNGQFLWIKATGAGINNSPFIAEIDGEKLIAVIDTYGEFHLLDMKGENVFENTFGYGYYNSPAISSKGILAIGSSAISISKSQWTEYENEVADEIIKYTGFKEHAEDFLDYLKTDDSISGPTSASAAIADVRGNGLCQIIVPTEDGYVTLIDENGKNPVCYKLPSGCEASVMVVDVDSDGKLEILVADLQGYLTCYGTKSKGKVDVSGFRNY